MKMSFKVARGCHDFSPTILPLADMWATASTKGQRNTKEFATVEKDQDGRWSMINRRRKKTSIISNTNAWHLENRT